MIKKYLILLEKAEEIRWKAPQLIEEGDWEEIRRLITVDETIMDGEVLTAYQKMVDSAVNDKNAYCVLRIPGAIEQAIEDIKSNDRRIAAEIRNKYGLN
ncbi:MAG: hypothetical protein IJH12_09690 [Clostridia bacterium]|nr:hypothetical protein [Clostridia bacterium]